MSSVFDESLKRAMAFAIGQHGSAEAALRVVLENIHRHAQYCPYKCKTCGTDLTKGSGDAAAILDEGFRQGAVPFCSPACAEKDPIHNDGEHKLINVKVKLNQESN